MSDIPINNMNFKQLRNEVQLLRDELAIFKRKYEDAIYNLDDDNFSSVITKEKDSMKAEIKVTAEEIKTKVSASDVDKKLESYSTISQTAEAISVSVVQINNATEERLMNYSTITQTAESVSTIISKSANLGEAIPVSSIAYATDTNAIYAVQTADSYGNITSEKYYYYNDITGDWEILSGESIYTVFEQTANGFSLKGNVSISGDLITTGTISADRISTEIAQVAGNLYIGDYNDASSSKSLIFGESMRISGITDGTSALSGCKISASGVYFSGLVTDGEEVSPRIYANNMLLATQDWVMSNVSSGGTTTVVFG